MAKRKSTRKQKNQNQLILGIVGGVILVAVIIGVVTQTQQAASTLPLEISVQEAYQYYQDDTLILDVRTQEEWDEGHVPGATLIPLDELEMRLSELPMDEEIVIICRSGNRSAVGRDILLDAGYTQVTSVAGGFNQWVANGFPVE